MADTFLSLTSAGRVSPDDVVIGASTSGAVIEVRLRDGAGLTKLEVIHALRTIESAVTQRGVPN